MPFPWPYPCTRSSPYSGFTPFAYCCPPTVTPFLTVTPLDIYGPVEEDLVCCWYKCLQSEPRERHCTYRGARVHRLGGSGKGALRAERLIWAVRGHTVRCVRVRALCVCCAKSRLFSTTGSHGSQGPEFCTLQPLLVHQGLFFLV